MQSDFTPEILVKHLYNETNHFEAKAIRNALSFDKTLQEQFNQLQEAKALLDENGDEEPDVATIQAILSYSKKISTVV